MKTIRLIKFINALNISRDEKSARDWLLKQGYPVVTTMDHMTECYSVTEETFGEIISAKRQEANREIERKQRDLASYSDLHSKLTQELRSDKPVRVQ